MDTKSQQHEKTPVLSEKDKVIILDPSDKFRPEKDEEEFRNFSNNSALYERVKNTYRLMHTKQTHTFAKERQAYWTKFNHAEMKLLEALETLNSLVDEADPDTDLPNAVHGFQTAERIREAHPNNEWLQLTGLIHDAGKIMAMYGEPQFCVVGDTFATGCEYSDKIVFGKKSFKDNPDYDHPIFSTKNGIYGEKCGLENVVMSWGHDEYLYWVLKNHKTCTLPEEALYIIRYHSFYPWHTGGDYMHLCNEKDLKMLPWVLEFNKFDLYSKSDSIPNQEELRSYYQSLIDKYVPGKIKF